MVHAYNSKRYGKHKKRVKPRHAGKHKKKFKTVFEKWKREESSVSPQTNVKDFWEYVLDDAKDLKEQYEKGKLTDKELKQKLDRLAESYYYDDEPNATVYYSDDDTPYEIKEYSNDTEGDFEAKWVSTSAWRGYNEIVPSKDWVNVHSDAILSYSKDAGELEDFDEKLRKKLDEKGIDYARVFSRTSNLFSTGYDFFVKRKDIDKVGKLVKELAKKHRDPERFQATALTGADPEQMTEADKMFVKSAKRLMAGESLEKVKKDILKKKKVK